MHATYRSGALIIAISALLALSAIKQHAATPVETVGVSAPYAAIADDFSEATTGSVGTPGGSVLRLTDEQRGFVFLGVINLPDIPEAMIDPPELGQMLPSTVALYPIPAMVRHKIPALASYKFAKLPDRILLVSADKREVGAAIPRYKLIVH